MDTIERREYNRRWRAAHPNYRTERRQRGRPPLPDDEREARHQARERRRQTDPATRPKRLARAAVRRALASGKIVRQPCPCGATKTQAHHPNYAEPLAVEWLCRAHHNDAHSAQK